MLLGSKVLFQIGFGKGAHMSVLPLCPNASIASPPLEQLGRVGFTSLFSGSCAKQRGWHPNKQLCAVNSREMAL